MGVYENLLKKKIINENEDGSVSVNQQQLDNVINSRPTQVKETNMWQQITNMANSMNTKVNQTINERIQATTPTFVQNIIKPMQNLSIEQKRQVTENKLNDVNKILNKPLWEKIQDVARDIGNLGKLTGLGVSSGNKNVLNYVETSNEQLYNNYRNIRNQQYLNVPNVSLENKAQAEMQNNLLLNSKGLGNDKNIETNLVKKSIRDSIVKDEKEIQETQSKLTNPLAQKLGEIAPSMGQMIPGTVLGTVNPVLGGEYFSTSAGGSYINDALQRGMTEKQAHLYGTIMGTLEGVSEQVITGQQLNKVMKAFGGKGLGNKILNSYGFNILENAVQEAVMEPAQELTAQIIGGKDKANWNGIWERIGNAGLNGGLMGLVTNGATYGLEKTGKAYNKIKNGQSLSEDEINSVIQENVKARGQEAVENDFKQGANQVFEQVPTIQNKQSNTQEQQITPPTQENVSNQNMVANNEQTTKFNIDLEKFKTGKYNQNDNIQVLDKLPDYFYNLGYDTQYPLSLNMDKLQTIMKEPKGYFDGKNQHGITMDIIEDLPRALNNPLNVIKNPKYNNRFVIVTDLVDQYGDMVVVPVEINSSSNLAEITGINKITSIYGKETYDTPQRDDVLSYMEQNKNNIVYDIDNERSSTSDYRLQLPSETSTTSSINNSIPQNNNFVKNDTITNNYAQTMENNTQNTPGEKINWNKIERPEGKFRKHYQSVIESSNTTAEAKAIAKEMMGTDTYVPESNQKHISEADSRIQSHGADNALTTLSTNVYDGDKRITAVDIATGERLIEYYSKIGDKEKLQEAIQATAMAGTQAGQAVQALSLLNHMTPQGQVTWIQRSVDKINKDLKKKRGNKAPQFELTAEMQQKIMQSENEQQLQQNLNEVYKELGQQVPKSFIEKIDSWRYFSMLGNPRTHIRNIVGNFFMGKTQDVKNKVAGVIEGTVSKFNPEMERTHTIKRPTKEVLQFAKNDIENVTDRLGLTENKYNPQSRIQNNQRTFKSDVWEYTLGKLFDLNNTALEAEDGWGLKAGYKKALAEYITANNLDIKNITDRQLSKARNYAVQEAQERTFHQANAVASAVNSFFNKNKVTKAIGDATVPFVKTPANVAKAGIEYSPVGMVKTLLKDTAQLRKGNITVNQYINNISKGLTGSSITVLGFALAQAGILKASGSDDDRKEKFDQQNGKQAYSIQIGDNTYTIDWLAPVGIPLMVGAEIYEGLSQKDSEKSSKSTDDSDVLQQFLSKAETFASSLSSTLNPMVEMSMLSNLTSAVRSFSQGETEALANMVTNAGKSYINQFVPTALGQIAKTTDTVERDTTTTKSGMIEKVVDSTKNQIMSKIPGLRQLLPTKKDIWGSDIKLADNWAERFFEAGILPTSKKKISEDKVVKNLNDLYETTGESSILPKTIEKTFTLDKKTYRMTDKEYNEYKRDYGKTSYKLLDNLIGSKEYKELNNEQKQKAIESIYSYAKELNKIDYAKKVGEEVTPSTLYNTMKALGNAKSQGEYLSYLSKTTGLDKESEKNSVLMDSNIDSTAKAIIYKNTTGKDDKVFDIAQNTMNIDQYLDYKVKSANKEFQADKDSNGNSISGTAKSKIYNYVNNNISGYENRLLILASQYKLSRAEQQKIVDYVNNHSKTNEEVIEKLEKLSSNFQVKDGKVYFK